MSDTDKLIPLSEDQTESLLKLQADAIASVMLIRCINHRNVPQQNKSEITGAECGACIAADRDSYRTLAQLKENYGDELRKANNRLVAENAELRGWLEDAQKLINEMTAVMKGQRV